MPEVSPGIEQTSNSLGVRVSSASDTDRRSTEVRKAEQSLLSTSSSGLQSHALSIEDDPLLFSLSRDVKVSIIAPPFNPVTLKRLAQANNTLNQCVAAMTTNVDGTGWEMVRKDGKTIEDGEIEKAKEAGALFDEPWPDTNFTMIRKAVRRDVETIGYGFMEIIRDTSNEIMFFRPLDAAITRLCKLSDPIPVDRKIERGGKTQTATIMERHRRYVQVVGNKVVYFKDFGVARELNRETGEWLEAGDSMEDHQEANELIMFTGDPDVSTPYGVPRWINQVPSILGSRKAEEMNLEFFDSGGIPPAMILIQGGELTGTSRTALDDFFAGKASKKQRIIVAELFSTSGDLNSSSHVGLTVERFGAEKQDDSMFENYDERCSKRVRGSFRLPQLFLGLSEDYNRATAVVAYMVAEAQVFAPERDEFDGIINTKLMQELSDTYVFRSLPVTLQDAEQQIRGLTISKDKVDKKSFVEAVNEVTNLKLTASEDVEGEPGILTPGGVQPMVTQVKPDEPPLEGVQKSEGDIYSLAKDWASHLTDRGMFSQGQLIQMKADRDGLDPGVRGLFNAYVGVLMAPGLHDPDGTAYLLACAGEHA